MSTEKAVSLLKEPSTYGGFAAVLGAFFGFDMFSPEQIAVVITGLFGMFISEKK